MSKVTDESLVARAGVAAATVASLADRTENERRMPAEGVRALVDAGVFKLLVPRELGGSEAPIPVVLEVLETISRADGSAGWCAMIGSTSALMSVYMDLAVAKEIYGPADAITCGVFAPMGRAERVEGGFRVSGRWPFASGCEHSSYRMGGTIVVGGEPDLLPSGAPNVQCMLFRSEETRVVDTWDVSGLRGTGSHDIEVEKVFVPKDRSFSLITDKPKHAASIYRVPFFGVGAAAIAAVALGIARGAIDAIVALARSKMPLGAKRSIAHRELVQLQMAQAESKVRAARAFLYEAVNDAVREAEAGELSLEKRALIRAAASHAAEESAAAVALAYHTGGATSIYSKNPLQRHFRDIHVVTQHIMVGPVAATLAGRVLLGVESDTSTL
jgi:alkylation response protein AidB-like acyl-CoA dehydrogenase